MVCLYLDGQLLLQAVLYLTIFAAGLASSIASGLAKVGLPVLAKLPEFCTVRH